jgi:hypothetical protein
VKHSHRDFMIKMTLLICVFWTNVGCACLYFYLQYFIFAFFELGFAGVIFTGLVYLTMKKTPNEAVNITVQHHIETVEDYTRILKHLLKQNEALKRATR